MGGRVTSIFAAPAKSAPRVSMEAAELVPDWGIEGDAYAGPGDRQVVLFAEEARRTLDQAIGDGHAAAVDPTENAGLCYPRFRENVAVAGLDPGTLSPGTRLVIEGAELVVTSTAKKCYPECSLPRRECAIQGHVAFCRVAVGGRVTIGSDICIA